MNNEITQLIDVITPEIFNDYMNIFTREKSAFVQSGVAVEDDRVSRNITAGGLLVNMPFWSDLTGEDEVLGDGDKALSTGKITADADIAAVLYRGRGWSVNELAAVISGDDPMQALMSKIGGYWLRREQRILISVLNGLFAAKSGTGEEATPDGQLFEQHFYDQKANPITETMLLDTKQLLGDAAEQLSLLVMHSAIYTSLQKLDLIDFLPASDGGRPIPIYQGYRVVVDDGVPVTGTTPATKVYTTYLFAQGSIGRSTGNPSQLTTFETDRDAAKGNDLVFTRRAFTMHPYGVAWKNEVREEGNITPTNEDLAHAANWKKVYEDKNIGIVALNSKAIVGQE